MTGRTRWQRSGILAAALLLAAPDAVACSIPPQNLSRAQVESYARKQYSAATAVVDAEVEEPMEFGPAYKSGLIPMAVLRVIRRYKGTGSFPGAERIAMVYFSSCDIALLRKGERVRILLTNGPELYRAEMMANGPAAEREEGLAEFNAEIDRLAGRPRPADFSAYPGALEPDASYPEAPSGNASMQRASPPQVVFVRSVKAETGIGVYIASVLGVLLAFAAGFLIGRRRRSAPRTT